MVFCKKCNAQLDDAAKMCPVCGSEELEAVAVDDNDHTSEFNARDISENKVIAMSVYLFGPLGLILGMIAASSSKYVAFHVRQALKIDIAMTLSVLMCIIPVLGWLVSLVALAALVVVQIICFVNACKGKAKNAPLVSGIPFLN